ncbi:MAG: putative metalloprotease CJM1_0395 family protein [Campylobacterota bacterium]|nr:putative metalloprotease CJM1_0395 family protein [Campylobacterota bacterium]
MMISPNISNFSSYTSNSSSDKKTQEDPSQNEDVKELEKADANVKAHEAAHLGAGGGVVSGGATFTYTQGSDGKMYATAGEVPIDTSEGKTPQETIQRASAIRAAAMAPSDPSPQDYKVAASAIIMEMKARQELSSEQNQDKEKNGLNEYAKVAMQ